MKKSTKSRTEFDEFIDERSDEIGEHPDKDKKYKEPETEIVDTRVGLTSNRLSHSLEITEYLLFLDLAMGLAERRVKGAAYEIIQTFLYYFFGIQEDYNKTNPIQSYEKKYPIFGGYVGVDVAFAQEYKKLLDEEEENRISWDDDIVGSKSYEYLTKHHILSFKDNDIKKLFEEPDAYIDLREKAYASYKSKFPDNTKNPKSKDKLEREQSGFTSKVINLKDKVLDGESLLLNNKNKFIANTFRNVATEVNEHLAKFGNDSYGKGVIKLNAHHKILLILFLLESAGVKNIPVGNLGSFMESLFGGDSGTYRKIIAHCRDNNQYCGYADPQTYSEAKDQIIAIIQNIRGEDSAKLTTLTANLKSKKGGELSALVKDAR